MHTIDLRLKNGNYKILIGHGILPQLGSAVGRLPIGRDAVVVTNPRIRKLYAGTIIKSLQRRGFSVRIFTVPDSERSKSSEIAFRLIEKIARYDTKRKIFIVALGGGVVGDLAGYVAATYKRGVPYVQVPTTLLAQIDSAIGGKVAIDLPMGKNLVGTFYQPRLVYSDVSLLKTLDKRQIRNGLAEAVKYGVIRDRKLFSYLEANYQKVLAGNAKVLAEIVRRCSTIKSQVVMADETETRGIRTILNFGHTLGHAIEAAGGYRSYHHGEAVALGMQIAGDISCRMKLWGQRESLRLAHLLTAIGLPSRLQKINLNRVLKIMAHDKKFKSGKNRFVLPFSIGKVRVLEGIPHKVILAAVKSRQ